MFTVLVKGYETAAAQACHDRGITVEETLNTVYTGITCWSVMLVNCPEMELYEWFAETAEFGGNGYPDGTLLFFSKNGTGVYEYE